MFTDLVGFSRVVEAFGIVHFLQLIQESEALFQPLIAAHGGRCLKHEGDSLLVVCGGSFGKKKIGRIAVPDYCWKVVQSLSTKKVLFCGWFTNTSAATVEEVSVAAVLKRTGMKIELKR
jgi:class 3 adenylate cyclase